MLITFSECDRSMTRREPNFWEVERPCWGCLPLISTNSANRILRKNSFGSVRFVPFSSPGSLVPDWQVPDYSRYRRRYWMERRGDGQVLSYRRFWCRLPDRPVRTSARSFSQTIRSEGMEERSLPVARRHDVRFARVGGGRDWSNRRIGFCHDELFSQVSFTATSLSSNIADCVTLTSMMPDHLTLLDRIDRLLSPTGLVSVADFYVSSRETSSMASVTGDVVSRQCSYWTRLFWQHW